MEINEFTNSRFLIDINNYKIDKKMEKLGFGTVYSVIDKETGQHFSAKVININLEEQKNQIVIEREIGIMMRLQHPTLIKFYGFSLKDFHGDNNITILMNYYKNGSLADLLEKNRSSKQSSILTNTFKQILLIGIARGMMILHKRHVIHRDLKTQNILIDQNMHPRITDYCLSKIFQTSDEASSQSQSNTAWFYVAPEVISSNKYTGKSDVYSYAIIMYEILTECIPYPHLSNGQTSTLQFGHKIVNEDYRPQFTVPIKKSFQNLIEKCWSKDPNQRPTFSEIYEQLSSTFESSIYHPADEESSASSREDANEDSLVLANVDENHVRSYITTITEDVSSILIEELSRKVEIIQLNNNQLLKDNKSLKKEIRSLRKENEQIKDRLKELEKMHTADQITTQKNAQEKAQGDDQKQQNQNDQQPQQQQQQQQQSAANLVVAAASPDGSSLKINETDGSLTSIGASGATIGENENRIMRLLLTKGFTLQFFNALPVSSQQAIIADIAQNTPNDESSPYFMELNKLLLYLLNLNGSTNGSAFIEITSLHHNERSVLTTILHNATELLHHNNALQSEQFIKMIKSIHDVEIEVRYPSKSFKKIYNKVHKIRRNELSGLKTAIFITGIHHTDITFAGNKHITEVRLDSCVTTITGGSMSGSFSFCTSLTKVAIPSTVTNIGDCAFLGCTSLTECKIPSSVTSIGFRAFEGCSSLTKMKIPSSVTTIGWRAFKECPSLTEISIPPSVTQIGDDAFPMNARVVRRQANK